MNIINPDELKSHQPKSRANQKQKKVNNKFKKKQKKDPAKSQPKPIKKDDEHRTLEGRYVLKKKICEGGFGKVYLAFDKIKKVYVITKINAELDMNDNEFEIMKHLSDKKLSGFP